MTAPESQVTSAPMVVSISCSEIHSHWRQRGNAGDGEVAAERAHRLNLQRFCGMVMDDER